MTKMIPSIGGARHIAIILHDFSTGGSERIAIRLANQWARRGRRITILCGVNQGPARALVAPDVVVRGVSPEIRRSPLSRFKLGRALAGIVAELEPDLIFVPGNFHISVAAALASALSAARPAFVCKLSNPLGQARRSAAAQWLFVRLLRLFTRSIDAYVAMSTALAREAATLLPASAVRVIHEPILDCDSEGIEPPGRASGDPPVIVCAGRLAPQKNFALAMEAFGLLDPAHGARLMILGEGEERAALERRARDHPHGDRIDMIGHVADIRPALAGARIFLMSSRYEGYPAVAIEALASGVPVVTTDCSPAIHEIMAHPSFGRVVGHDAIVLARAIEAMLGAGGPDPEQTAALLDRHRIDRVARDYLDMFDWTVLARRALLMGDRARCPA